MCEFCLPTTGTMVPASPEWLHEIKFDGYRLRVERNGDRVRLITRGGYDWTERYPWINRPAQTVDLWRYKSYTPLAVSHLFMICMRCFI
jgi:ATP-dependent DNA ligase